MAIYPCDWSQHRYPDGQQSMYLVWLAGNAIGGNCLRLCPKHFREAFTIAQLHMAIVDENSQPSTMCDKCGGERDGLLHVRFFPARQEEVQMAADLCVTCSETVGNHLRASNGRPLRASVAGFNNVEGAVGMHSQMR